MIATGNNIRTANDESRTEVERWSNLARAKPTAGDGSSNKKPKLGQNFLIDHEAVERIVEALGPLKEASVVEIGPGKAALTDVLVRRAGCVIAVELDHVLAAKLRLRYNTARNVEIIEADILTVDFATMLGIRVGPLRDLRPTARNKVRVVGNLPYYITSDILLRLFSAHPLVEKIVIMVQLEVADRIAAESGTSEYGLLSATAQLYARVEKLFKLPPTAFWPPPKVHSAVLRLTIEPRFEELQVDEEGFISFLKISFAQKRKTLFNNLKLQFDADAVKRALAEASVKADVRSEALSLEKMARIYRQLAPTQAAS